MVGKERYGYLCHRQVPIPARRYLWLHAQREYVIPPRLFLAGANRHPGRSEDQGTIRETAGDQCRRSFHSKGTSTDLLPSPGPGAGSSGDGYSRRLRVRTGPGCPLLSCGFTLGLLIYSYRSRGGMCERLKQAVLKTALPERVTGVRIPLPPPSKFPRTRIAKQAFCFVSGHDFSQARKNSVP